MILSDFYIKYLPWLLSSVLYFNNQSFTQSGESRIYLSDMGSMLEIEQTAYGAFTQIKSFFQLDIVLISRRSTGEQ